MPLKAVLISRTFPAFSESLRKELVAGGLLHLYKKNEILTRNRQPLLSTYVILQGCVKVFREKSLPEHSDFFVTFLGDGNAYGVSICDETPPESKISMLTFKAIADSYVLILPFGLKDQLAVKYVQWYQYILQTAVQFYKFYVLLIDNIAFATLPGKIDFFLQQLSSARHSSTVSVTHQEIADSLNASRESVSRLLKQKEKVGKLRLGRHTIELL